MTPSLRLCGPLRYLHLAIATLLLTLLACKSARNTHEQALTPMEAELSALYDKNYTLALVPYQGDSEGAKNKFIFQSCFASPSQEHSAGFRCADAFRLQDGSPLLATLHTIKKDGELPHAVKKDKLLDHRDVRAYVSYKEAMAERNNQLLTQVGEFAGWMGLTIGSATLLWKEASGWGLKGFLGGALLTLELSVFAYSFWNLHGSVDDLANITDANERAARARARVEEIAKESGSDKITAPVTAQSKRGETILNISDQWQSLHGMEAEGRQEVTSVPDFLKSFGNLLRQQMGESKGPHEFCLPHHRMEKRCFTL